MCAGGLAIGVPGEVLGMYEAWRRFGRLPWPDLFLPVIDLCENGFVVERALANAMVEHEMDIRSDPNLRSVCVTVAAVMCLVCSEVVCVLSPTLLFQGAKLYKNL